MLQMAIKTEFLSFKLTHFFQGKNIFTLSGETDKKNEKANEMPGNQVLAGQTVTPTQKNLIGISTILEKQKPPTSNGIQTQKYLFSKNMQRHTCALCIK